MSHNVWIDMETAVAEQLALQVDLSFERHHGFMADHGLESCGRVVDLGTGDGLFLSRVAARHPDIRFAGVDDKPVMIHRSRARTMPHVKWVLADALKPAALDLVAAADGILARYFLLHMPDTRTALATVGAQVRPGTRLWVFDLDIEACRCDPPEPAYELFTNLVRAFCDHNNVEIRTSRMLPPALEEVGFRVDTVAVEPFNNQVVDPDLFSRYLFQEAALYHFCLHGTPASPELEPFSTFLFQTMDRATHFVQYGMVMVAATRIDA